MHVATADSVCSDWEADVSCCSIHGLSVVQCHNICCPTECSLHHGHGDLPGWNVRGIES